eukprot:Lithocolla_globosa_v1_NODE_4558_length_1410_cov_11.761624.p2 type:complete len:112 gc:universal NODE_4558_length_1410_cov_11.761624:374-709(+)
MAPIGSRGGQYFEARKALRSTTVFTITSLRWSWVSASAIKMRSAYIRQYKNRQHFKKTSVATSAMTKMVNSGAWPSFSIRVLKDSTITIREAVPMIEAKTSTPTGSTRSRP